MIAIIDYGVGNLFSLSRSLNAVGAESVVTSDINEIERAGKLVLPGVGAFGDAVDKLRQSGLDTIITEQCKKGKPLLGICLGMQLLFEKSYEYGEHKGLGLIKGEILPLKECVGNLKVPHMGWNTLNIRRSNELFKYTKPGEYVYFVHSFYAKCGEAVAATTSYGVEIAAAVRQNNIYGMQFHPEKSGVAGLNMLRAFNELKVQI